MAVDSQNLGATLGTKRGVTVYQTNPSVPAKGDISRPRRRQLGNEQKGLVIEDGTGAILGRGTAVAYEMEEVDAERFVKLFLSGLKQAADLSKAGLQIFEVVYNQLREKPNTDQVNLSVTTTKQIIEGLTDRTYWRGLKELIDKEFLFRTPYDGTYFVNIRYMFNGDRLAFVKAYHLKGSKRNDAQLSLLPEEGAEEPKPVN